MSTADAPMWDVQQREWLQALGLDVLALASSQDVAPEAVTSETVAPETVLNPAGPVRPVAPPHARQQAREAASQAARELARDKAPAPDALRQALARAAGRSLDDVDLQGVLPPLASLRGNPAARRALWPQLRALRRRSRG